MSVAAARFAVRDPRGTRPAIVCAPLAARPATLDGKTVWLLRSWAEGSGFEPLLQAIAQRLAERFPGARVVQAAKPSAYSLDDPALWAKIAAEACAFVYAAAPSASTTHYAVHYSAGLERRGLPGVVLTYETLAEDARHSVDGCGVAVRWLAAPYPPDGVPAAALRALADAAVDALLRAARPDELQQGTRTMPPPPHIAFEGTLDEVHRHFEEQGWTDGLPVLPPTDEAVARLLAGTSQPPQAPVTTAMGPEGLQVSVEQVAINAAMAGCPPAALPIVLAAVEAFARGLPGAPAAFSTPARATNSFAFMQVVNGPIRHLAGMNAGLNALGPGNRANATIGRALWFAILNLGGGVIGRNLLPVQGNPAARGFAFAEHEEASPWPSLAASRGFSAADSVLTLFSGGWSHVGNYIEDSIERLAADAARFEYPNGLTLLLSPPRARRLAADGLSKEAVEERVWRLATQPAASVRRDVYWATLIEPNLRLPPERRLWSPELLSAADDMLVPVYPRSQVRAIVVGGEISPMMQAWKMGSALSVSIDRWR